MKEQMGRSLRGYVRICVLGSMPERFLNLCGKNGILVWKLENVNDRYEMNLSVKDFFRLKPFLRKSRCKISVLEKHGMPFFFHKTRKRKAFFLGFLLAASILYFLSSFVWNIHVTGNLSNSTQAVLEVLRQEGIVHGLPKRKVSCQEIADLLREKFDNIVWVSAKIQGTQLVLEIKENTDSFQTPEQSTDTPSDLRATKNGTVVEIVTRSGVPGVTVGDSCQKGTVLISGTLPIYNDSQEIVRYDQVVADGDVYIQTSYHYWKEIPLKYKKRIYTGENSHQVFLQLLDWRLTFGGSFSLPKTYDQFTKSQMLHLTENFVLPVIYGTVETRPYQILDETYTEEEVRNLAAEQLEKYLIELEGKGCRILSQNVNIQVTESSCVSSGSIQVIEKNGMLAEIEGVSDSPKVLPP